MTTNDAARVEELIDEFERSNAYQWNDSDVAELVELAGHRDDSVADPAIEYLETIGNVAASKLTPHTETLAESIVEDGTLRKERTKLFHVLNKVGESDPQAVARIADFLFEYHATEERIWEQSSVEEALASAALADDSIVDRLADRLEDPRADHRANSASVLAKLGERETAELEPAVSAL